ncbi:MAG: type IX secretion system membrane protein PorP/SprF [Prevotellaceae bacterium]|jgi:type IX secretion system PorP/SprF family membrane protein|nr:type IX secretion system membrane protein PorP/SprF [Prevotellaceae bacterium]
MKVKLIIFLTLIIPIKTIAQTDIQTSQHMFNRTTYNPSVTGASQYINIYGHWRDQWQGFSEAPQTMYLTANRYFKEIKSGLGIAAIKDKIGFERNMLFKLSYAYHVYLSSNSYLSLGFSAGVLNRNIDWTKKQITDPDPNLPNEMENKWTANFDFGIEYNMERFTVGLSVTHLNRSAKSATYNNMGHHFYGYVKYKFELGADFELTPALFAQNSKKSTHLEGNLLLHYRNRAWIGASYRMDEKLNSESVVGIIGIDLMDFLRIGYSFDYNIGHIGKYSNNTHEIMLGIRLARVQKVYARSPRFFE